MALAERRSSNTGEVTVSAVATGAGLEELQAEWQRLADSCRTATVFQAWEWNAAWWRHFGAAPGRRLRLVTVRAGGELVGLVPLMTSYWYATPLRRLSFLGTGAADYLDALAAPGWENEVCGALYAHLAQTGGWHVADFQQLREGGLLRALPPAPDSRLHFWDSAQEPCPYLPLPETWDALTRGLGKKTRANINYYDRALRKVYDVQSGPVTDEGELDTEMSRLFELHQRRWNQRWLPGVFGGRRVQKFHRDVARALLRRDFLRLFVLKLDGETQACLYCFAFGDRLCYYQGGFEPTLARLSLGTVLTSHALKTGIDEGRGTFDFLRGDEPYKSKWTTRAAVNHRRLVTRPGTVLGILARQTQRVEEGAERRLKAWARTR